MSRSSEWIRESKAIARVLADSPAIDKNLRVERAEFQARQAALIKALEATGIDAAFVHSDEHYNGDVPYLAGNTSITIEPVAGVIGRGGFHVLAGLEP